MKSTQWIGEDIDGAGFTVDLGDVTTIQQPAAHLGQRGRRCRGRG